MQFFRVRDFLRGSMHESDVINFQEKQERHADAKATFFSYTAQGLVHWRHMQQRPLSFQPFLASTPFPPLVPPTALLLMEHIGTIQAEFEAVLLNHKAKITELSQDDPRLLAEGAIPGQHTLFEFISEVGCGTMHNAR
jgi:hypothetical protein